MQEEFELRIICMPEQTFEVLDTLKELNIEFEKREETALAPISPETLLDIVIKGAPLVPIIIELFKRFYDRGKRVTFETRFEFAKKMLSDKKPLFCDYREDRADYSRYVFKTKESLFFWEYDRGNVKYGRERSETT